VLKHRLIPCVLLKDWQLVKSVQFGSFRTIGHPTATVRVYNSRNVDELIVLDIDASLNNEAINLEVIADMANECFMPLTIGGGINTLDDVSAVLQAGADKVAVNSQAIKDPTFIHKIAKKFGSQCVVASMDLIKIDGDYCVYNKKLGQLDLEPLSLAKEYEKQGAGELLLTAIDHEGMHMGYDLALLDLFKDQLNIPIIINGGMGSPEDAVAALEHGADALAAAYIFHFTQYTPYMIKEELNKHHYPVRLT